MPLIRFGYQISDEFECEDPELASKSSEFAHVRPCERYKEMYRSCNSLFGKLNQYYIYGEVLNCDSHWDNYKACKSYRKTGETNDLKPIIEWEKDLIHTREMTVSQNTTWEMRDNPPTEFVKPLPDYIQKNHSRSLLSRIKT